MIDTKNKSDNSKEMSASMKLQPPKDSLTNKVLTTTKANKIRLIGFTEISALKKMIKIDTMKENRSRKEMIAHKRTGDLQ